MKNKQYLTIRQAAKVIGVSELTLRNWDNQKKFEASRHPMNNYRLYSVNQIDELLKKMGKKRVSRKLMIRVLED